jgi:stage II sporulation protein D
MVMLTRTCVHLRRLSPRRVGARRLVAGATIAGLLGVGLTVLPDSADARASSSSRSFTLKGSGYGHGYGMSQYGAYGAAKAGLSWKQILAFYYPGTTLDLMSAGTTIKVWVTADNDDSLRVLPAKGLRVEDGAGHKFVVPTGSKYASWRISRSGSGYELSYRSSGGSSTTVKTGLANGTWSFHTAGHLVKVVMPSGSVREYRGSVFLVRSGSGARTVNRVKLEDYVKAVVPAEMPTSWAEDAVRVQAVAARSYAVRLRDFTNYSGYDICDTTACQVYGGYAVTIKGKRTVRETAAGNAAVAATASTIVKYQGAVALTMFASSNGGHTAQGSYRYLAPRRDPYDNDIKSQAWTTRVSAGRIAKAWPSVGSVRSLKVISRDGDGAWGGRVQKIKIVGSRKSLTVTGGTFKSKLGLRSTLFTVG